MNRIVIARYKENLDWIAGVPEDFAIHVFNKGPKLDGAPSRAIIVELPNQGRESDTYLTFIRDAVHKPDGMTVFAQGDPLEHSPDFLGLLRQWRYWQPAQPLSWRWRPARQIPPPAILAREQSEFAGGLRLRSELFSLATWSPLGFSDPGTHWLEAAYRQLHQLAPGANIAAHFLRLCGLDALAATAEQHQLGRFAYGALFAASNDVLAALDPAALDLLREAARSHEVYGYMLERLWLHLCGAPFELPVAIAAPSPHVPLQRAFAPPDRRSQSRRRLDRLARRLRHLVAGERVG